MVAETVPLSANPFGPQQPRPWPGKVGSGSLSIGLLASKTSVRRLLNGALANANLGASVR